MRRITLSVLLVSALAVAACGVRGCGWWQQADRGWPMHGGDPGHQQYSPLSQIDTTNVGRLQVAWTFRTGDARADGRSQIQCNPIIVGRVLYATSAQLKTFALDAATGRQLWAFDPFAGGADGRSAALGVNRGVVYWASGDDRRILVAAGERLYALEAGTGRPIPSFGTNGSVGLREGLGRESEPLYVLSNTPGAIYDDLLILGTRVSEGPGPSAPGHIRAFDVRTGKIRWTFHTIPHPGEFGYDTWPADAWTRVGGANAWSGISVDDQRGLVFLPTGSAAFDFWGGNRHGTNLFANSVLVLNARTGERVWHYQIVRHDLWDRDLPAAPVLVTVEQNGRRIDAVAQITKSGHVWVLDRTTGEPLFPVSEVPAPPSDLKGEHAWPTQLLPMKPPAFARQSLTEENVTDIAHASREAVLKQLRATRTGRQFIPPSREGTVIFPGFDGGGEWGGAAFDPDSGLLYVNSNEMPWILTMVEVDRTKETSAFARGRRLYQLNCAVCHGIDRKGNALQRYPLLLDIEKRMPREQTADLITAGKGLMPAFPMLAGGERQDLVAYMFGDTPKPGEKPTEETPDPTVPYTTTGYNRFLDPDGYPAVKPPWGTLNAIDLNRGEIVWRVPLGEYPELTKRGVPLTGTENYGGPVVTAGGLVFIAATRDERIRAFDKRSGRMLWEAPLPAGGYATPATYAVDGRQYVVIAAGGGKMGTKSGDSYVAFSLTEN
jgi:quinoprotein glucose dehydrogenase